MGVAVVAAVVVRKIKWTHKRHKHSLKINKVMASSKGQLNSKLTPSPHSDLQITNNQ